jgi:hypothetical protein
MNSAGRDTHSNLVCAVAQTENRGPLEALAATLNAALRTG